jgi:ubiquinone/menaquinone biosynthesis C-methylase UbiE
LSSWKKKRAMIERYDATAHIYDVRYFEEQTIKIKAALKHVQIDANSVLLDAGCGTGVLFEHIADKVSAIVGIDVSKKSLLEAKKRAGKSENIFLVRSDVDNMPFVRVFTHIFAVTLLQNTPNPRDTLKELRNVAKHDAVFIITGLKKIFTKKEFLALLSDSRIKIEFLEEEDNLKCYVAVGSVGHH